MLLDSVSFSKQFVLKAVGGNCSSYTFEIIFQESRNEEFSSR